MPSAARPHALPRPTRPRGASRRDPARGERGPLAGRVRPERAPRQAASSGAGAPLRRGTPAWQVAAPGGHRARTKRAQVPGPRLAHSRMTLGSWPAGNAGGCRDTYRTGRHAPRLSAYRGAMSALSLPNINECLHLVQPGGGGVAALAPGPPVPGLVPKVRAFREWAWSPRPPRSHKVRGAGIGRGKAGMRTRPEIRRPLQFALPRMRFSVRFR